MNKDAKYIEFTTSILDKELKPIESIRTRIQLRDGIDSREAQYIVLNHINELRIVAYKNKHPSITHYEGTSYE